MPDEPNTNETTNETTNDAAGQQAAPQAPASPGAPADNKPPTPSAGTGEAGGDSKPLFTPGDQPPAGPEYEAFTFPDGYQANTDTSAFKAFTASLREQGLDQQAAQAALNATLKMEEALVSQVQVETEAKAKEWDDAARTQGLHTTDVTARATGSVAVLDPTGDLANRLRETGLHRHPAIIRVFSEYAGRRAEGGIAAGAAAPPPPAGGDGLEGLFRRSEEQAQQGG